MLVLGIETSCDETSVGVVRDGRELLSNSVLSQIDIHAEYGGIVPEIAARSHLEAMNPMIEQALKEADVAWNDIDAIGVTYGAGLSGSLLIGATTARVLAIVKDKPLYACNHVEGHVYANYLTSYESPEIRDGRPALPSRQPAFPLLALIVSGKHSQLVLFRDHGDYDLLGQAQDDAIGEAFDKVARILGLPYPGGPSIAKIATDGDPDKYTLPISRIAGDYNFSFSGIKTAVLRLCQGLAGGDHAMPSFEIAQHLSEVQKADVAASFQKTAVKTVVDKTIKAYEEFQPKDVVIAGGVAASQELRAQLTERLPIDIQYAPIGLCTDNGAMIACLCCHQIMNEMDPADPYTLGINPSLSM
ncbi:MAG: tRNA (adenosine(37)-N6)-threonylcarbamoyltransferase complex transferase subunit TsaD [Patescibacteria group bacterium]